MLWQGAEVSILLAWRGWEVGMAMTSHTICMQNTCTTWTRWNIRNWKCPLLCSLASALVLEFLSMQSFSSKRRQLQPSSSYATILSSWEGPRLADWLSRLLLYCFEICFRLKFVMDFPCNSGNNRFCGCFLSCYKTWCLDIFISLYGLCSLFLFGSVAWLN